MGGGGKRGNFCVTLRIENIVAGTSLILAGIILGYVGYFVVSGKMDDQTRSFRDKLDKETEISYVEGSLEVYGCRNFRYH